MTVIELEWDNHSSKIHPDKPEKPGNDDNWIDKTGTGELPPYIERIKKHLMSDEGMTESRAIATAVNTVKKWAKGVNHNGNRVSAKTQKTAAAAVAEWNAKKAAAGKKKDLTRAPARRSGVLNLARRIWAWLDSPVAGPKPVELIKGDADNDGIPYEAKKNKRNNKRGLRPAPATPRPELGQDAARNPATGSRAFNQLSEPDQRRAVRQQAAARSDALSQAATKQATKQAVAKTPQAAAKRLPAAVWQGRAQRISRMSKGSIARALARKSDQELAALRAAIEGINDKVGKTGGTKLTGGDQGFYTFLKILSAEQKKRAT